MALYKFLTKNRQWQSPKLSLQVICNDKFTLKYKNIRLGATFLKGGDLTKNSSFWIKMALFKSLTQNRQSRDPKSPPTMHAFEALSHNCTLPFESQCLVLVEAYASLSILSKEFGFKIRVYDNLHPFRSHCFDIFMALMSFGSGLEHFSGVSWLCLYSDGDGPPPKGPALEVRLKKPSAIFMRQFQAPHFNTNGLKARTHLLLVQLCPLSPLESCRF